MSKLEEHVISLIEKIFGKTTIKREVSVKKLFPKYSSHKDRYDIVLPLYNIIIETHGEQHRSLVQFSKQQDLGDVQIEFQHAKRRDSRKQEIAEDNNWTYIVIWYDELSTNEYLNIEMLNKKLQKSYSCGGKET